ncbi:MAG: hypothetical protein K9G76_00610 [Bacteroidales bacterium]|nr:hypothetical protein [Bacteroidales bacterium]MCF8402614.1 hypothetical protein [Bacteroidales bacterium]
MKELKRTRRLIIVSIIFVFIIIIGLISLRKPDFEYQLSTNEMLEEIYNIENEMLPDEAMEIMAYGDSSYQFIDLRNPYDFNKGFLGNAINIPVSDILEKESFEFFNQLEEDSVILVLYAENQLQANGAWMILKQLGFSNIKILLGGYSYISNENIDFYNLPDVPEYFVEEPFMDFATLIEEASNPDKSEAFTTDNDTQKITPLKRKKKSASEGGC